jgi:hypothetical protein
MIMTIESTKRSYFVDEAGDGTLFSKKGGVIIGQEGCSRYFILGVLDVADQEALASELTILRQQLLADPYFKKVPSMQPEAKKTHFAFHAKDDVPEVRREVFAVIRKFDLRFLAVVRNKHKVLEYVRQRNSQDSTYHYHLNELYDYMVRVLFKNLLHKDDSYEIYFSKRWKQDRTEALQKALESAQQRFDQQYGVCSMATFSVHPKTPKESGGLQVVDYFLWALQRFYELKEDRYLEFVWPSIRLIHDLDDTRKTGAGIFYTQKRPLTLAVLDDTLPGI